MRFYTLMLIGLLALSALLYGCGGSTSAGLPDNDGPAGSGGFNLQIPSGPGMPQATPDDIQITEDGKIVSNTYRKFFADAVNEHSWGRWSAFNGGGQKTWTLSNTYYSAPKAFLFGGNYWNHENDFIQSNSFNVPDATDGVRLTFTARWKIAPGDTCTAVYNALGGPQTVANFTGGQNPDYPGWTKYYFELPANFSGQDQSNTIQFFFLSDSSVTDFGFAFDDVAVYQRQLEPPLNVSASDGNFSIILNWTNNPAGTLVPEGYDIYRSTTQGGNYRFQANVSYPGTFWNDPTAIQGPTYYYVIKSQHVGWPDSVFSNEDSGFIMGGP